MARFRVGCQLWPQHTTTGEMRRAWREADAMGVDSLWVWDHFFPLRGDPSGAHFEGWTLLAAMAADTERAQVGTLVTGVGYRNPDLLADMARTVDHLSGGRAYLGVGAGWFERDYVEYGFEFGTAPQRLVTLERALERIRSRLAALRPAPAGPLPILIGGGGEKVTLRLVATYGDAWNTFGPLDNFVRKSEILDSWCEKVGRDPTAIERTVSLMSEEDLDQVDRYVAAGATHVIVSTPEPFDLGPVRRVLEVAAG